MALFLSGCVKTDDELPDDLQTSITDSVHLIAGKDAYVRSQPLLVASALFDRINGLSNAVVRVRSVNRFVDELCAMDTTGLTYSQIGVLAEDIHIIDLREISNTLQASTHDWTIVYRARMQLTDLLKRMFESVRPKQKRGKSEDVETVRLRGEWITCYRRLYMIIKNREKRLELMQDLELEEVGLEERQRVRAEVERLLGRKLRTADEIDKAYEERSEEYLSVMRREFDPPEWQGRREIPDGVIIR